METLNRKLLPSIHTPGLEIGPQKEYPVKVM